MTQPMLLAVKLLLATGQRGDEDLRAAWPEFDQVEKVWVTPGGDRDNPISARIRKTPIP